jgi:serine/threonine protein kinase
LLAESFKPTIFAHMNSEEPWSEKWEIVEWFPESGQGKAGVVKARAGTPDKAVLKILRKPKEKRARQRMFSEVLNLTMAHQAGAKVPKYLDGNINPGNAEGENPLYFVMEFIEGPTLKDLIKDKGALSVEEAIAVALDLCKSLKSALPIIHRDIKPENMKIRDVSKWDVVLLDFGLSFNTDLESGPTETGEPLGNSFLRLPELTSYNDDRRDGRSDLTLVCGILFYCLTGNAPGNLANGKEIPPHVSSESELSKKLGDKWPRFKALFTIGFSRNVDHRFKTLGDLISRLEELLLADPKPQPIAELLKHSSDSLFRLDPKTQVKACEEKVKSLTFKFSEVLAKNAHPLFKIGITSDERSPDLRREANEFRLLRLKVFVEHHREVAKAFYLRFVLDRGLCVVYREHFDSDASPIPSLSPRPHVEILSSKVVYEYGMQDAPDIGELVKVLEEGLSQAISDLTKCLVKRAEEQSAEKEPVTQNEAEETWNPAWDHL